MMHGVFDRLFGPAEEINGRERCSTYLYRWVLAKTPWGNAYLHRFVGDDWTADLHDHPKAFISVGLAGEYVEETPDTLTIWRAPWVRSFPASHRHRLTLRPGRQCWTLVIVLRAEREWGFWPNGRFVPWREYVDGPDGDAGKACE